MENKKINKIVGFLINQEKQPPEIDFFKVGLKTISLKQGEFYIHFWGIGEIVNKMTPSNKRDHLFGRLKNLFLA